MKLVHFPMDNEEQIAAYIDGKLSPEDMRAFSEEMSNNELLADFVSGIKVDNFNDSVSVEQIESNFDPIGTIDKLFSQTDYLLEKGTAINEEMIGQMNPLDNFLCIQSNDIPDNLIQLEIENDNGLPESFQDNIDTNSIDLTLGEPSNDDF